MKVLVISHNVLNGNTNMGITLSSYFRGNGAAEIAQFYIHSEIPADASVCHNYFRFTDKDAIRSLVPWLRCGRIFSKKDIQKDRLSAGEDSSIIHSAYQIGRKRTALIYALRNILWKLSRWETRRLWNWVDEFSPDVIFFASGDYEFMYDLARKIADHTGKPLVISCVDDFYLYGRNEESLLGRWVHRSFLKTVNRTMARASAVMTICASMQREYEKLFGKKTYVLHTAAVAETTTESQEQSGISYLGNLANERNKQLAAIGRALQGIQAPGMPKWIDVYSGEKDPEKLKDMIPENGIRFHGAVPSEQVLSVMQSSMAVIHTESFDPSIRKMIRFSVSTKIADTLMHGPCLIAYGPDGIASMDYLKENGAAYTITDPAQLETGLREILSNEELRNQTVGRARRLAQQNHSIQVIPEKVTKWLTEICREYVQI